jgi:hypothetical protein
MPGSRCLSIGLFAVLLACVSANAEAAAPFNPATCRNAQLDRVVNGQVVSRESVVVCKPKGNAAANKRRTSMAASQPASPVEHVVERVAFAAPHNPEVECAMLSCPTFVLTGVGF